MTVKKRGLGRGLDALIERTPEEMVRRLPVASLRPNRLQPRTRFEETAIAELTESIRTQGIVQPLLLVADGGQRHQSPALLAGAGSGSREQLQGCFQVVVGRVDVVLAR